METNYSEQQAMRDVAEARANFDGAIRGPSPWWYLALMSLPFPLLGLGMYVEGRAAYAIIGAAFLLSVSAIFYATLSQRRKGVQPDLMREFTRDTAMLIVSVIAGILWLVSLPVIDINGLPRELHLVNGSIIGFVLFGMLVRADRRAQRAGSKGHVGR